MVDSLARFSKTLVREVMTPRPDIESIGADASIAELRGLMRESKYSRIPVYREKPDEIMGIVTVRDVVEYEGDETQPVESIARSVFLVPETKKIAELLKELQNEHVTFAVVLDEYGEPQASCRSRTSSRSWWARSRTSTTSRPSRSSSRTTARCSSRGVPVSIC